MRLGHWHAFNPVCPRCLAANEQALPLDLSIHEQIDQVVMQGVASCANARCEQKFPIIDGIPILVADLPSYISAWANQLLQRNDLPSFASSLVDESLPTSETYHLMRQYLSTYGWDGYSEFDTDLPVAERCTDSSARRSVQVATTGCESNAARLLDLGCGVGRSTFQLAHQNVGLVLGIEQNFPFMQLAQSVTLRGEASYPLRRYGVVYEQRQFSVALEAAERCDFWVCDATALPFVEQSIDGLVALNLLDSVPDPLELLQSIERVLAKGGYAALATPFEWREALTARAQWIGGHSAGLVHAGDPVAVLKLVLKDPGYRVQSLAVEFEGDDLVWRTRIDNRAATEYTNYVVRLRKRKV